MSIFSSIKDLLFHPNINLTKEFEDYSSFLSPHYDVETAAKEMNYEKVEGCRLTVNLQAKTEVEVIGLAVTAGKGEVDVSEEGKLSLT
jgi:hypothetical protein